MSEKETKISPLEFIARKVAAETLSKFPELSKSEFLDYAAPLLLREYHASVGETLDDTDAELAASYLAETYDIFHQARKKTWKHYIPAAIGTAIATALAYLGVKRLHLAEKLAAKLAKKFGSKIEALGEAEKNLPTIAPQNIPTPTRIAQPARTATGFYREAPVESAMARRHFMRPKALAETTGEYGTMEAGGRELLGLPESPAVGMAGEVEAGTKSRETTMEAIRAMKDMKFVKPEDIDRVLKNYESIVFKARKGNKDVLETVIEELRKGAEQ